MTPLLTIDVDRYQPLLPKASRASVEATPPGSSAGASSLATTASIPHGAIPGPIRAAEPASMQDAPIVELASMGYIFLCTTETEKDCLTQMLFGAPEHALKKMEGIAPRPGSARYGMWPPLSTTNHSSALSVMHERGSGLLYCNCFVIQPLLRERDDS